MAIRKEKLWPKMTKPLCGLYYNKQVWFVRIKKGHFDENYSLSVLLLGHEWIELEKSQI